MKHALGFCFLSAFFIGPTLSSLCFSNCTDCAGTCVDAYHSAVQLAYTIPEYCKAIKTYLSCLMSCGQDLSLAIQEIEANYGSDCDLSGYSGSTSVSVSLLTALVGLLFTAYQNFRL